MILRIIRLDYWIKEYKNTAEKPFVCPNCGSEFHKKWYNLLFYRYTTLRSFGKANTDKAIARRDGRVREDYKTVWLLRR